MADGGAGDVDLAVAAARRALSGPWGKLTGFGRAALLRRLGGLIARDANALAEIETATIKETGPATRRRAGRRGAGRPGIGGEWVVWRV